MPEMDKKLKMSSRVTKKLKHGNTEYPVFVNSIRKISTRCRLDGNDKNNISLEGPG
jgi:hypothetical protein